MAEFAPGDTVCIDYAQSWQPAEQEAHAQAEQPPAPADWMAGVVIEARSAGEYLVQVHANLTVVISGDHMRSRASDEPCA